MKYVLIGLLLLASASAQAFTPETGLWWNPDESGRGFGIEVQNETLVLTVYVYTPDGEPVFYQGIGAMQGQFVEGELARKSGGQCITCEYTEPATQPGFAGPFEIQFSSETTGTLTWNGGEVPIQRFVFGWGDELEKMLGEWQMVIDFSAANNGDFFASGDVLVFDRTGLNEGQEQFLGYRVNSEFDQTGDRLGDAAGVYLPDNDLHVILVDDSSDQFLIYYLEVGTRQFEGIAELYDKDTDPTGEGFPVQGFRTATRAAVQAKTITPLMFSSKAFTRQGLNAPPAAQWGVVPGEGVGLKSLDKQIDLSKLRAAVERLTWTLEQRELR